MLLASYNFTDSKCLLLFINVYFFIFFIIQGYHNIITVYVADFDLSNIVMCWSVQFY